MVVTHEVGTAKLDSVEQCLRERDGVLVVLKTNLEMAQHRMRQQANQPRTEREFIVGDFVYLRLVPYQLQALNSHSYHKLQPRFYGPYELLEKI